MGYGHPRWFAKQIPDRPAMMMCPSGLQLAYAHMQDHANWFARFFRSAGLRAGYKFAFRLENRLDLFASIGSTQRTGINCVVTSDKRSFALLCHIPTAANY